ncbi:MAG: hypothetical protein E4G90_03265 [Gemmatimonadales bacterium]|nr:MAG: hypothetical protein E4G90_03265 [Gemmatimonadales bacterium]
MSLGWGEVPAGDWAGLKTKPGADQVPPGDYEVQVKKYMHFEPKEQGSVGAHVLVCEVTEKNAEAVGKELHIRLNYDPNPINDGRRKMNLISQQNAKALFEATATEQVLSPNGNVNIVETLQALPTKAPTLIVLVTEKAGSEYQETKNFRPSPA